MPKAKVKLLLKIVRQHLVLIPPYLWVVIFVILPFSMVLKLSFSEAVISIPPFKPLFEYFDKGMIQIQLYLSNYHLILEDPLYASSLWQSVKLSSTATFFCLILGFPMAYAITRSKSSLKPFLLLLVILPFWTSFLLRVYAWMGLLSQSGTINDILISLGLIKTPLKLLYTDASVIMGMIYCYLPFMVLPLYATLERFDMRLLEAASDLGCKPLSAFLKITLPLTYKGIITGCMLVFIPALGEFVIPELLGDSKTLMLGKIIWLEFFNNRDWPVASTLAILMLVLTLLPLTFIQKRVEQ